MAPNDASTSDAMTARETSAVDTMTDDTDAPPAVDANATDAGTVDVTGALDTMMTDAVADAIVSDAITDQTDSDAGCQSNPQRACPCTAVSPNSPNARGVQSLACYCADPRFATTCYSWDVAQSCLDISRVDEIVFDTYGTCNLVTISYYIGTTWSYTRVYDATTHALVGMGHARSTADFQCGADFVPTVEAGLFPAPCCVITKTEKPCRYIGPDPLPEPGPDASDGDADISPPEDGATEASPDASPDAPSAIHDGGADSSQY
jgi:hypothetical protein